MVWVGFENTEMFEDLKVGVDGALQECGIPLSEYPFRAHLTLGRVRSLKDLIGFYDVLAEKKDKFNELVTYPDNVRQIQALSETGILDEKVAHLLRRIYLVYRATVHRLNLSEKPHTVPSGTFQDLRQHVEKIWSFYLNP